MTKQFVERVSHLVSTWACLHVPGAGVAAPSLPTGGVVVVPFAFLLPCFLLHAFFPGAGVTTTTPVTMGWPSCLSPLTYWLLYNTWMSTQLNEVQMVTAITYSN